MSLRPANIDDLIAAIDASRFAEAAELPEVVTGMMEEHAGFLGIESPLFPVALSAEDDLKLKRKLMELAANIEHETRGMTRNCTANRKTTQKLYAGMMDAGLFKTSETTPEQHSMPRPGRAFPGR